MAGQRGPVSDVRVKEAEFFSISDEFYITSGGFRGFGCHPRNGLAATQTWTQRVSFDAEGFN